MKRTFRRVISKVLITTMLATVATGITTYPINESAYAALSSATLINADFEEGNPSGWTTTGTVAAQNSDKHGGTYSVKLSAANSTISQTLTDIPQGSYTLSAWVKGGTSSNTAFMTATQTGGPDGKSTVDAFINNTSWTQIAIRNVLVYNGQVNVSIGSGNGTNLAVDDVQLTLDSDDSNPTVNWNFETNGGSLTGWNVDKGSVSTTTDSDTGTTAAVLSADSQLSQVINVKPNTSYIATVRAKVDKQDTWKTTYQSNHLGKTGELVDVVSYGDRINLGVKNLSGTVLRQAPAGIAGYALLTIAFKTGPSDNQVTLYANTINDVNYQNSVKVYGEVANHENGNKQDQWTSNGTDKAYVDNFDVFEIDNSIVKGADVSFLPLIEDVGGKYFANGVQQDCLAILSNHGVNAITGMIMVHSGNQIYDQSSPKQPMYSTYFTDANGNFPPYTMQAGYYDKIHSYQLAQRAKDLNMDYFPNFMFSDGWMSAGTAPTPLEWMYKDASGNLVDQTLDEMTTTMYNYVYDFIKGLMDQGTPPMGLKMGNEEDGGIVWNTGKSYKGAGFKALINAAYDAAHAAAPGIKGFIHSNNGYDIANSNTIFGYLSSTNVKFDGQAYSLYGGRPTGSIIGMLLNNTSLYPDKDYLNPETGYAFTRYNPDWLDESGSIGQTAYWANTPNGQYNYLLDYMQAYLDVPNPHATMRGFFYWESDWITVEGAASATGGGNSIDRRIMFNNGDPSIKEMGSTANGKMGDMMDSMYAHLIRGDVKNKAASVQTGLGTYGTYTVTKTSPTGITLSNSTLSMVEGSTKKLLPTIAPVNSVTDWTINWTSNNSSVATVDKSGNVTAVSPGTAIITATTEDGDLTAQSTVTVTAAVTVGAGNMVMKVNGNTVSGSFSAMVNDKVKIAVTLPAGTTNKTVKFTSSNPQVASFLGETWQSSYPGTLYQQTDVTTGVQLNVKKDGTTTITATSADGTALQTFTLTANKTAVANITLNATTATMSLGDTKQLVATVTPANATFNTVKWSSSDPTVASVDSTGLVKTLKEGTAIITATSDDNAALKAIFTATVVPVMVTGLDLSKSSLSLMVNSLKQVNAIITPSNANDKTVEWSTTDPTVATVDSNGNVTGIKVGTTTLVATAHDTRNGTYSKSIPVTVQSTAIAASGVSMNTEYYYFTSDYFSETNKSLTAPTYQLAANVTPTDATNTDVTWMSSNPSIATVNQYGVVTALKSGSAVITATTKDGGYTASSTVFVPIYSESFENRSTTTTDNWSVVAGMSSSTGATGTFVSAVTNVSAGNVFQVAGAAAGASTQKVFTSPVVNNKVTLSFDWNVGSPSAANGAGQLSIDDSAGNRYLTLQYKSATEMTYAVGGVVENVVIASPAAANVGSGFNTNNTVYKLMATINLASRTIDFTIINKSNSAIKATKTNIPFEPNTAYQNNVAKIQFAGAVTGWTTWIDNFNVYGESPVASSISIDKTSIAPLAGTTTQLTAVVVPNVKGVSQSVTWTSSDPSVATVSSNGLVTAVGAGVTTITAASIANPAIKAASTVNIHTGVIPIEGLGINKGSTDVSGTTLTVPTGESIQLKPAINPGSADMRSITWSSSDPAVAAVDSDGLVTVLSAGTADITLSIDNYSTALSTEHVTIEGTGPAVANTLNLKNAINSAMASKTQPDDYYLSASLTVYKAALATAQSDYAAAQANKWDPSHQYQLDKDTSDLITVTAGLIKNPNIPMTSLSMTASTMYLVAGTASQIAVTYSPSYATNSNLVWTSSNPSVAIVDGNGVVVAIAKGIATITAKTADGSLQAVNTVTVSDNLSVGKPSTASASRAGFPASAANDSSSLTFWNVGAHTLNSSLKVDLGAVAKINSSFISSWNTIAYKIEVSNDDVTYTMAFDHTASLTSGNSSTDTMPANVYGRYVKVTITNTQASTSWVQLYDFHVYGAFVATATAISLDKSFATIEKDSTLQLTPAITPLNATASVSWTSDKASVATVNSSGLVTAVGVGTATITATTSNGLTATSTITVADTTAPAEVTGTKVTTSDQAITITWEDPADIDFDHVVISGSEFTSKNVAKGIKQVKITGLTNDQAYTITLKTVDATGNVSTGVSVNGTPAHDGTPTAEVTTAAAAGGDQKLTITWTDPTDIDFDHVVISGTGVTTQNVEAGVETATITGLMNGTAYTVLIQTVDADGNKSMGVTVSGTPYDNKAPGEVTASAVTAAYGKLSITWVDPTDDDFKEVKVSGAGVTTQTVAKGVQSVTLTGLTNATAYTIKIQTVDMNGNVSTGTTVGGIPNMNISIGNQISGGVGYKRTISVDGGDLTGKYLVVQYTEGSGARAKVSIAVVDASDSTDISYQTDGTQIKVWLVSGIPNLTAADMGVTVFASAVTGVVLDRYPYGLHKALTFSYDDGMVQDRRMVALFNKYNMKATFHLNSGFLDTASTYVTSSEVSTLYAGHELAAHTVNHINLVTLSTADAVKSIKDDQTAISALSGYPIYGLALPNGGTNSSVKSAIASSTTIRYARTASSSLNFDLPDDFLQWTDTVRDIDTSNLNKLGDDFLNLGSNGKMNLYSVWGHSWELDNPATYKISWTIMEDFLSKMSNKPDIWYATNIQITDYVNAVRALKVTKSTVFNPSPTLSVWATINGAVKEIKPLQTIDY
ncbi:Ig-like domain-containing protein [Paenibacillus aurantiacus]|uniref:Arabinogalactan endo-beta-1,4-galactanase n=1 Tax=Paenibacillus aurantiacus TaxID=1936118 RepID=A0ABV5KUC4_9BACL